MPFETPIAILTGCILFYHVHRNRRRYTKFAYRNYCVWLILYYKRFLFFNVWCQKRLTDGEYVRVAYNTTSRSRPTCWNMLNFRLNPIETCVCTIFFLKYIYLSKIDYIFLKMALFPNFNSDIYTNRNFRTFFFLYALI